MDLDEILIVFANLIFNWKFKKLGTCFKFRSKFATKRLKQIFTERKVGRLELVWIWTLYCRKKINRIQLEKTELRDVFYQSDITFLYVWSQYDGTSPLLNLLPRLTLGHNTKHLTTHMHTALASNAHQTSIRPISRVRTNANLYPLLLPLLWALFHGPQLRLLLHRLFPGQTKLLGFSRFFLSNERKKEKKTVKKQKNECG